jgi:hypothetical protein
MGLLPINFLPVEKVGIETLGALETGLKIPKSPLLKPN